MKTYYGFISKNAATKHSIPPPRKVSLNEHNIIYAEEALLNAYRYDDPDSIYRLIQKSPFWRLMHDGIVENQKEYHGTYLRVLDENNSPTNIPFGLTNVPGGVTGLQTG